MARKLLVHMTTLAFLAASAPGVRGDEAERSAAAKPEATASKSAPEAKTAKPTISEEAVSKLVRDLDDDRYAVRKSAQKALAAAGAAAVHAVGEAARNGSLESSTRAVSILMNWANQSDDELSLPALEILAQLKNRPTEAALAQGRLAVVREKAAIAAIEKLGGYVEPDRPMAIIAGEGDTPLKIIIGPQWKGGVDGLGHIAAVRRASTLSLWAAPVDDSAIAQLDKIQHMTRLEVYGTDISDEALEKIQNRYQQIDVRRGGARLGVRGLKIEEVVVDSPAEKAGLQVDDEIAGFEGVKIEDFEHLTREIAKCQPGDQRTIEVIRQGKPVQVKVTFDRWGDDPDFNRRQPEPANEDPFGANPQRR